LYFESCTLGKPLVGSTFTLALVTGQMIWDRMKSGFQRRSSRGTDLLPVGSPGGARIQVAPVREERDVRDDQLQPGGEAVITSKRTIMVYRRGHAPKIARISPGGDE
jgi:itaconyl-CoA hydratase